MLVSCILPTKNRAAFIPQAIRCYQSQTYPHKELVIVDNGDDGTEKLIPADPTIRYAKVFGKLTVGDMRNACANWSRGEYICHFDSDDWSAPERVADQVTRLGEFGVLTGYHDMLFYDERDGKLYQWHMPHSPARFALGTSMCYRRIWWRSHPFMSIQIGEDIRFFRQAMREAHRFVPTAPAGQMMVARVHDYQTSKKSLNKTSYRPMPPTALPPAFPCGLISSAI
jgi:glycosyltransferase involved in cell wall biosynthesis